MTNLMLDGKGFVSFTSIRIKDELFIDDRFKKIANALCIKLFKNLIVHSDPVDIRRLRPQFVHD